MAHFIGFIRSKDKETYRTGTKRDGLRMVAASYQGCVRVTLHERDGIDHATVRLEPWQGAGTTRLLYDGPVGGTE